jgi:protein-S-isoprenylcysteine O-methyltransferase Ste14
MAYHDGHSPSLGSKVTLLLLTLVGVLFSLNLLFQNQPSDLTRTFLLLTCAIVFYVRLALCLLIFVKRKVSWFEGCAVGALYGVLVYVFSLWGSLAPAKDCVLDYIGMGLFVAGSWINSQADYQRFRWKKKPENAGHLYTKGLFKYAMHINFFGDTVMFVGYALITQCFMSFIPVAAITLNFVLIQIPQLDGYLMNKYGAEFTEYAVRTKKYIPLALASKKRQ